MPGHKNGAGFQGTPLDSMLFSFDTTELNGTDALIQPTGAILEAEKRAAMLYGAKHSFYLVGGSTVGILAMLYAAFRPGDRVIVDRNCHQSVLNGAALAGIHPVYVTPEESVLTGVPGTVSPEAIRNLLQKHSGIRGAVITSPNYYGAAADIQNISALLHENNAVLLVDEAHGAHFPFADAFPGSAMMQGADMSVTSLHKTLAAPNQTALLHIGSRFEIEAVRIAVRMFQTSSPSYVLLAAMEQALELAAKHGQGKTKHLLPMLKALDCPSLDDPFKLLPSWSEKGITGYQAEEIFRKQFGIYAELADSHRVLLMASWYNSQDDFHLLGKALDYVNSLPPQNSPLPPVPTRGSFDSLPALTPGEVRRCGQRRIPLTAAAGGICAQTVAAFPPCIPILLPGEVITLERIDEIMRHRENGATMMGIDENTVAVVKIESHKEK